MAHNKLPSSKAGIQKVEALGEKYILLDSLLVKISTMPEKEMAVLAIPEMCVNSIIALYHLSLFTGHHPNLIHYLRSYIKGCHICQLTRNENHLADSCKLE